MKPTQSVRDFSAHDKHGRSYARLSELHAGSKVRIDGDFECMPPWSSRIVENDPDKSDNDFPRLWIPCKEGRHYLGGQLASDNDTLIGVYHATE
jgi:hypothetical protein